MTTLATSETETNFTEMELQVLDYLKDCDEYDEKPYAHIDDISSYTKIGMNSLRGVLASLIKKDKIELQHDFFRRGDTIIFKLS